MLTRSKASGGEDQQKKTKLDVKGSIEEYCEETQQDDHLSPTIRALKISLVVEEISKYLRTDDLVMLREVSHLFKQEATKILRRRKALQLSILIEGIQVFIIKGSKSNKIPLQKLYPPMRKQRVSPSPWTTLNVSSDKNVQVLANLTNFLQQRGEHVKRLIFDKSWNNVKSSANLLKDLLVHGPNIEHLTITMNESRSFIHSVSLFIQPVKLPNLKTLIIHGFEESDISLIKEILDAAHNIEEYHDQQSTLHELPLDMLTSINKIHTLRKAIFFPSINSIDFYQNFPDIDIKLRKLYLISVLLVKESNLLKVAEVALKNILYSCKDSLEHLYIFPIDMLTFKFPIFTNLFCLTIANRLDTRESMFPQNFSLELTFPKLKQIILDVSDLSADIDHFWQSYFPSRANFPMIESFTSIYKIHQNQIPKLPTIFPNLTELVLHLGRFPSEYISTIKLIWRHFKNLKSLKLAMEIHSLAHDPAILDSAFTGYSHDHCKLLKSQEEDGNNQANNNSEFELLEVLQEESILQLTELTFLDIRFLCCACTFNSWRGGQILSMVTGKYAFKKMPKLRVDISIRCQQVKQYRSRINQLLGSIAPYTFVQLVEI